MERERTFIPRPPSPASFGDLVLPASGTAQGAFSGPVGASAPVQRFAAQEGSGEGLLRPRGHSFGKLALQPPGAKEAAASLPDPLRSNIHRLSGVSLDDVQVRYSSPRPGRLGARALAQRREIHVAPGEERHVPHEAWHLVQQKRGRVRPTRQEAGVAINHDPALEREADVMGARASEGTGIGTPRPRTQSSLAGEGPAATSAPAQAMANAPTSGQQTPGASGGGSRLKGPYAAAFAALTGATASGSQAAPGPVAQLMLTGEYAEAAVKIGTYMGKSAARSAETILQEAQDLGFRAPNLPGHMSSSSGKDSKGEKERQKQIKAAFNKWKLDFAEWKRSRKDDEDEEGGTGGMTTSNNSNQRSTSKKEEYREYRKQEKRETYEKSQESTYVPPWHGGPSAWIPRKFDN